MDWKFLTLLLIPTVLFQLLCSKDLWRVKIARMILIAVTFLVMGLPLALGMPLLMKLPAGMDVVLIFFYQMIILGVFVYLLHSDRFKQKLGSAESNRDDCLTKN